MTNKGLISKTQKKLTQLDSKKVNKLIKKNKKKNIKALRYLIILFSIKYFSYAVSTKFYV